MKDLVEKEEGNLMKLLPSSIYHRRTWYPTVTKTLWILAQLHEFINVSHTRLFVIFFPSDCSPAAGRVQRHSPRSY